MRVYMDNGATTRVTEPVMAAMQPYFCEIYGIVHIIPHK